MKVVAFEDDAATLEALRKAFNLAHIGFVGFRFPPPDAVDQVAHAKPNAVVSDVNMPGLTGLQLGKKLRGDRRTRKVPIFYYSSMPHEAIAHEVASIKNAAFISKQERLPHEVAETIIAMSWQDHWSP